MDAQRDKLARVVSRTTRQLTTLATSTCLDEKAEKSATFGDWDRVLFHRNILVYYIKLLW